MGHVHAGYCSHSSVTFPTWHRPYVAMMEVRDFILLRNPNLPPSAELFILQQAVYVAMVKIANQFTDQTIQQNYLDACARFRFPYWDPCLPRETSTQAQFGVPRIVSSPSVYVRKPANPELLVQVDNPLYSFKFPTAVQPLNNPDFSWEQKDLANPNVRHSPRPLSRRFI